MSTDSLSERGRLQLKILEKDKVEADTVLHAPADATQAMNVSPRSFDGTLKLGERFVDLGLVTTGGMSLIHRVLEKNLCRQVAMKVIAPNLAQEEEHLFRFITEAQITGQLEHPNIPPVYELGADDLGTHFFTLKLVKGRTLKEFMDQEKTDQPEDTLYEALQTFLKVCDALAYAHSHGVIHRDIKPSNIMVGEHGQVYLMDWGIAYLLKNMAAPQDGEAIADVLVQTPDLPGTLVGTYSYMSPEQAHGLVDAIDDRSDIFSMGAVLYFILSGRPPYEGLSVQEVLVKAQQCEFTPVDEVIESFPLQLLCQIVQKAMAPDPSDRYQTVVDLKRDVEAVLRGRWRYPVVRHPAGTIILQEGEKGDEAYVIRSGTCEVYRTIQGRKMWVATLGPGEFFGETAVFTGDERTASVKAIDEVELWVVAGRTLQKELGLDSWMGGFVSTMGKRFSQGTEKVGHLQAELAREQVLREMILFFALNGQERQPGTRTVGWSELLESVGSAFRVKEPYLMEIIESEPFLRADTTDGEVKTVTLMP